MIDVIRSIRERVLLRHQDMRDGLADRFAMDADMRGRHVDQSQVDRSVSNLGALERMTFDEFLPDGVGMPEAIRRALREAYELCRTYARDPHGWLVLLGGYGAGKTHLAAAIANYRVALGHPVLFVVVLLLTLLVFRTARSWVYYEGESR